MLIDRMHVAPANQPLSDCQPVSMPKGSDEGCMPRAGVSNFGIDELAELLAMARIKPALVQRHSDPLAADADVQAFCRIAGIQYQVTHLPRSSCGSRGSDPGLSRFHAGLYNCLQQQQQQQRSRVHKCCGGRRGWQCVPFISSG